MFIPIQASYLLYNSVSAANGTKKISSKSFYIEYRMAVGYAIASGSVIPYFNSLEEWEAAKSTKMDIVAKIIKHTLSSDQALPVTFIDGQPIFTPIPPLAAGEVPSNKVVVFQEFPSLGRVLRNVRLLIFLLFTAHWPNFRCLTFIKSLMST